MNKSLRKTVQYMLTGLLGLIISEIFGALLGWGMLKTSDASPAVMFDSFTGKWHVPFFLIVLALNFFRIGHGLVLLESNARRFQSYKRFIGKRTHLSLFQIVILLSFVWFGITLLRTLSGGNSTFLGITHSIEVGFLSMLLFALLGLWDIPTAYFYLKDWRKEKRNYKGNSRTSTDEILSQVIKFGKEKWDEDIVFKSVIIWAFYDIVCIACMLFGHFVLRLGETTQLIYSSVLLSTILLLDYFPLLLILNEKLKSVFRNFTNCELYFAD